MKSRGSWLEKAIETCNRQYRLNKRARVDKVATPTSVNPKKGTAYFTKKSTVDFTGFYKGGAVAFDTKETGVTNFPFKNVHQHQVDYLKEVKTYYNVDAFLLIWFKKYQELYKIDIDDYIELQEYYRNEEKRESIPYKWFKLKGNEIKKGKYVYYDYLEIE